MNRIVQVGEQRKAAPAMRDRPLENRSISNKPPNICYSYYMTPPLKKSPDIERDRLLTRMRAAKENGNRQEVNDCLAQAKRRLRKNYIGDNPIRGAQSQLLRLFPPAH